MKATLVVIAGYLAAEIFLEGYAAAAAVFALGLSEYVFMLAVKRKKHPSLIVEGAVLAGTSLLGSLLARAGYPGAEFVLLELVLGGVLLGSTLIGRPWLSSLMERMPMFPMGREMAGEASIAMGLLFLAHGVLAAAALIVTGSVPIPQAVLAFAILYAITILFMRRRMGQLAGSDAPMLKPGDDDMTRLEKSGRVLGTLRLEVARATTADDVRITPGVKTHEFLDALESCLRRRGCRALQLSSWEGDDLDLEIGSYRRTPDGWIKLL
jgi:hypothetical protein